MSPEEIYHSLETNENGLSEREAQRRLKIYGYNELESRRFGWDPILLRQFKNPIFVILIACAIMAKEVGTVALDKSVFDAAALMSERELSYLIVVDGKTPVGIVTPDDFVRRVVSKKVPPDTKISDIMLKLLITVEHDDTMQDAARIMVGHKIEKLPVVKENKLVGLLTVADFAR
jgi:CBS domain-containing protein